MFYTKITELLFNNGEKLALKPDDIVIFVGPNNCGKSQSLRDIYNKCSNTSPAVVIKDVELSLGEKEEFVKALTSLSMKQESINPVYSGYGYSILQSILTTYGDSKIHQQLRSFLISYLQTDNRLFICSAPNVIDSNEPQTHPIHYLYDKDYQSIISKYFKEAFGYELIPDYLARKKVHLLMGDIPKIDCGGKAPDIMSELEKKFQNYPKVDEQGDGMRSFTGVILHLILKNYGVYLIDEPESFLHPPQAMILGKVVGELLGNDRQAFISTHSEDFIKGLMEQCPERIKVIRITRDGDENSFAILDNEQFKNIWGDPLLKHSNIMSSLFHKNVVLCESDSDCRFYSIVLDYLKQQDGKYSETLFTYCSGKQRMKQVATALKSLFIEFRCIPDLDVFNDKQTIKGLFEACGGTWSSTIDKDFLANVNFRIPA